MNLAYFQTTDNKLSQFEQERMGLHVYRSVSNSCLTWVADVFCLSGVPGHRICTDLHFAGSHFIRSCLNAQLYRNVYDKRSQLCEIVFFRYFC